ncbi:MAG: beta-ketoacyl-ACP synthase II, partial [Chloroflexota bacterium]|nr:beta-ketoacyl-ACP synthase II [Chloroflexota bacterium]
QYDVLQVKGPRRVSPFYMPNFIVDSASGHIAIRHGLLGPNMAIVSACATGGHSVGEAYETIRRDDADAMLAGGTEACIHPIVYAGFSVIKALADNNDEPERACRPFELNRSGFVLAEGCAVLILEELQHALDRGAEPLAEVMGYGSGNDAFHMANQPEGGVGAARVMRMALRKAGLDPSEVSYINAHGTGTTVNDRSETAAIKDVFGEYAYRLPVSSVKSMIGHTMGAAGAIEAMTCVQVIRERCIPPTINYVVPDPECDLDYVPNTARSAEVDVAISNSLGLGGHNSCLAFRRYGE